MLATKFFCQLCLISQILPLHNHVSGSTFASRATPMRRITTSCFLQMELHGQHGAASGAATFCC